MDDLIARVRAAKEPFAELFDSVQQILAPTDDWAIDDTEKWDWFAQFAFCVAARAWTDAALALVEMKLPAKDGWWVNLLAIGGIRPCAEIHDSQRTYAELAPHPALAVVLALLVTVKETENDA
jgi:hypothetical protein